LHQKYFTVEKEGTTVAHSNTRTKEWRPRQQGRLLHSMREKFNNIEGKRPIHRSPDNHRERRGGRGEKSTENARLGRENGCGSAVTTLLLPSPKSAHCTGQRRKREKSVLAAVKSRGWLIGLVRTVLIFLTLGYIEVRSFLREGESPQRREEGRKSDFGSIRQKKIAVLAIRKKKRRTEPRPSPRRELLRCQRRGCTLSGDLIDQKNFRPLNTVTTIARRGWRVLVSIHRWS